MSRKKGQTYSAEQKTKIVLELLREEQPIAELATKYKITSQSISKWKKHFIFTCKNLYVLHTKNSKKE